MKRLFALIAMAASAHAAQLKTDSFQDWPASTSPGLIQAPTFNGASLPAQRTWLYVDPTNGLDSNTGLNPAYPLKSITNAVTKTSAGQGIYAGPGWYDYGPSNIEMKANTWLWGAGTNQTITIGYADLSGHRGGQIIPNTNCYIRGLQIRCDTNNLVSHIAGGHSGTWSGIGFTQDGTDQICPTNIFIEDVLIRDGYFDAVHINQTNQWTITCRNVVVDNNGNGFNFISQSGTHQNSLARLFNCTTYSRDQVPQSVVDAGGFWYPGFLSTDTYIETENCFGVIATNGGGSLSGVAPQMFTLDASRSSSNTAALYVRGGSFWNKNFSDANDFGKQANVWGFCQYNGTNYSKLRNKTDGSILTNIPTSAIVTGGYIVTNQNANVFIQAAELDLTGSTNFVSGQTRYSGNISCSTNSNGVVPDFNMPETLVTTNAAFTILAPVNVDTSGKTYQSTVFFVTNSTASVVNITGPANVHVIGTANVTNLTKIVFERIGAGCTNMTSVPIF